MQTGVRLTRDDVIDYAKQAINVIIQVGRKGGIPGVLEVLLPWPSWHHVCHRVHRYNRRRPPIFGRPRDEATIHSIGGENSPSGYLHRTGEIQFFRLIHSGS